MIASLLTREGGYTNDPNDKGGETKFGISKRQFPTLDIANLTADQAAAIYRQRYLDGPGISKLPDFIQPLMLDFAVNSGPAIAIQKLQLVVGLEPDGVIGPETIAKAQMWDGRKLINGLMAERIRMICRVVIKAPVQLKFLTGWINRCLEFMV